MQPFLTSNGIVIKSNVIKRALKNNKEAGKSHNVAGHNVKNCTNKEREENKISTGKQILSNCICKRTRLSWSYELNND